MEPTKTLSYGKSILVPSVQELAKEPRDSVPERYLRLDQHLQTISPPNSQLEIPVVDLGKLLNAESMASELEKLHSACVHWGFFQLVNHGVSSSLVEKMKLEVQGFFNLPIEKKKKLWQQPGEVEGFGQAFVVSEEQKLDWADMFFLTTLPPSMRKSHLYNNLPPSFRETMEAYGVELLKLAFTLTGQMAKALGMEEGEMSDLFEEGFQALRMNYYPPCPQPEKVIGLTPHSDGVGLTLLLQVNEMEGLQIRKDGEWIPVRPLPEAFIVNIGDILEIVSNGTYRSIEHRGVVNPAKERLSVAAFHSPKITGELGPAPSLISQERPALFKRVGVEKYFKELFSRKLDGKSYLDYLRIDQECSKDGVACDHLSGSV